MFGLLGAALKTAAIIQDKTLNSASESLNGKRTY
jgi:hypothetical protein